jgi:hypothetical protein
MIDQLIKRFSYLEREIRALTYVLIALFLVLAYRAASLTYEGKYDELWLLIAPTITVLAALQVTSVPNRLIVNDRINRMNDQNREIIRITHHLIAVCKDLDSKVYYVKLMLSDNTRPSFILDKLATSIEDRYEALLERDAFKYLPGNCVDIITRISGTIYGMHMFAEGMKHITRSNPLVPLKRGAEKSGGDQIIPQLDKLLDDIESLINELFKLRESIEGKQNE